MKVFCNKCVHHKWISIFRTESVTGDVCKLSRYEKHHPTHSEEAYLSCMDTNADNECKDYKEKCTFISRVKKRFFTKVKPEPKIIENRYEIMDL